MFGVTTRCSQKGCSQKECSQKGYSQKGCRQNQQGAALLLTLTTLLMLTVLGVSSVLTTSLQEKMAHNNRHVSMVFQGAESTLLVAERYLQTLQTTTSLAAFPREAAASPCAGGLCRSTDGRWAADSGDVDWDDASTFVNTTTGTDPVRLDGTTGYIIEHIARISAGDPDSPHELHIFRITAMARGASAQAGTSVMIQTTWGQWLLKDDGLVSDEADGGPDPATDTLVHEAPTNNTGRLSWRRLDATFD